MGRTGGGAVDRAITPGSDFLQLNLAEAPAGGRCDWLTGQLRSAIADGRLPVGSRLPASRALAGELGVSRGVVTEAYQRLSEDGQVAGRGRGGTVVLAAPAGQPPARARPPERGGPSGAEARAAGARAAEVLAAEVFAAQPGPGVFDSLRAIPARIDLSPGVPDLAAFPRAAWLRAERAVLGDLSPADFGYGDPRGTPALRRAVAGWLARTRGIRADPDEVIIVAGVAQALALLAQVLRETGIAEMATEDPGSFGARQQLQNWGLATPPVGVDADGVRVDELAASGAAAVMLTPAHQFPTGVVLDGRRRRELMRWAGDGGLILEDDYDAEHRYDRPPVPALHSMLAEQVCYAGSVSKLLAPALRVGWLLAPPRYRGALVAGKRNTDLGNAALPQLVLAALMESGELGRQLRFLRGRHRRRRDAMIAAVRAHLPGAVVHGAAAGLHLMITFDAGFADADLAAAALAGGVKVQPLSWHRQRPGPPGLVLGYAASPPADITEAIAILGAVADRML
jgi:GntR family transcriptional regulator/MocR family aminotransferase